MYSGSWVSDTNRELAFTLGIQAVLGGQFFLIGGALVAQQSEESVHYGKIIRAGGIFIALFSGLINIQIMRACKRRGTLAVRTLCRTLLLQSPGTCATMLYLSSYSMRCIFATATVDIWAQVRSDEE
jgi:hypothetical protein